MTDEPKSVWHTCRELADAISNLMSNKFTEANQPLDPRLQGVLVNPPTEYYAYKHGRGLKANEQGVINQAI